MLTCAPSRFTFRTRATVGSRRQGEILMTTETTALPLGANLLSHGEDLKVVARDASRPAADGAEVVKRAAGSRKRLLAAAGFLLLAGAGGAYAYAHHGLEDTDDAQLEGDLVNVSA